jgi:translin
MAKNMNKNRFSKKIEKIFRELEKAEKELDDILIASRESIRHCANAIKFIHLKELEKAKKEIKNAKEKIGKYKKTKKFGYLLLQPYQEIAEATILLAAVENKPIPYWKELEMPFEAYLLGLCDVIGELRREMLEMLKKGDKKSAERYYTLMNEIYTAMLPIRFSESILPNFRKKQDVARIQIEQARAEMFRAHMN